MELFQDIPQVIQAEILCQWLAQHEVTRLDSALCSKTIRPLFLSVLTGNCVFPSLDTANFDQADWVVLRNIKVKELVLRHSTQASIRENLFRTVSQSLTEIQLCPEDFLEEEDESISIDDTFFDIALLCPMVQELTARHVVATTCLNLVILKCSQLKSLTLENCTGIESKTIKSICNAPNLSYLDVSFSQLNLDVADFSVHKSASLRKLIYLCLQPVCGDDLVTIAGLCPHVKDTNITLGEALTEENAVLLCKQWPQIELLQLQREQSTEVVCSELAVLTLLKGCPQLLKLSVCSLDYPHLKDYLHYSTSSGTSASILSSTGTASDGSNITSTRATMSKVTDLFLEYASEATLRVILTLCPLLNTLALRHRFPFMPVQGGTIDTQRAAEYALSSMNHPTCSVRKLHLHNIRSLAGVDLLSLTNLEELQLSNIGSHFSNDLIQNVVKNNPNLRSISLYNCQQLRGYTLILALLKLCPALHTFNFTECDALRKDSNFMSFSTATAVIESLIRDGYPNIKKVNIKL